MLLAFKQYRTRVLIKDAALIKETWYVCYVAKYEIIDKFILGKPEPIMLKILPIISFSTS